MTLARLSAVLVNRYARNPVTKGGTEVLCLQYREYWNNCVGITENTEMVTVSENKASVSENCANIIN
jgi:hypothetical protein